MSSFSKYFSLVLLAFTVFVTPAQAQQRHTLDVQQELALFEDSAPVEDEVPGYVRFRLPEGRRCTVGAEMFQCYNFEEFQELLRMDIDLRFADLDLQNALQRVDRLEGIAQQLQLALDAANEQIDELQFERRDLLEQWAEENRLRLEAENRPMFGSWVAWTVAAIAAVGIGVLSVALAFAL